MRQERVLLILLIASPLICFVSSANILVLLPLASKSHKNVFEPLISALSERNHTLTVVSPVAPSKERKNVRELVPTKFASKMSSILGNPIEMRRKGTLGMMFNTFDFVFEACHEVYENEEFRALEKEKFDLIFLDAFINDCLTGFIRKLGVPFILVAPQAAPTSITEFVGNRLPLSFVPSPMLPFSDAMTFPQRLANMGLLLIGDFMGTFVFAGKTEAIYRKYLGEDLPGVQELYGDVSMIFSNSHFAFTFPRPLLPDVVEVGGMHCRPAKKLPKELEEFASGAKDGLILFSLGSIIQGKDMPEDIRRIFLKAFSRLKQRVLWKWETEDMPDIPANVKLTKWVPQQDVLGHPNTVLFMTHGGLLSTQEATYHGVPLVGIPIFADQDLNIRQAERAGYARAVEILELTEERLVEVIRDVLEEPKYKERAQYLSSIYRDQMETPLARAVYWSEYVIRHRGAHHLRSAARKLNFFQYYSLDVIGAILTLVLLILWLTKLLICKIVLTCRRRRVVPGKKDN